jgi:outer membrane protein assembly factor BamD (BamD/ComL family)
VPSLSRELSSLEGVRRAIDKGDARRALAKLEAHDREYPSGALSIEAEYLRIESLIAAGKRGAARASAERFLAAHPGAPQARRVQSLLRGLAAE